MLPNSAQAQGPFYLKAHWDFTNAFSTATDISGNGHRGYSGIVEVQVTGMNGQRVLQQSFSQKATDTELKINTEKLAPGSYLININAGATGSQQKFIKQ
ncbi:MAG: T9SS type A sorting domain-containing protein [Bacteroidetes bacterium]|nr:T9SS type A sorting domain-containing protein [Bacteroidota bacterium]